MRLYILRHGETDKNREKVLQGRMNTALNEAGRSQAARAGVELQGIKFDEIYVSPLERTMETAEIATGLSRDHFIPEDRIIEISFGEMEGMTVENPTGNLANFFLNPEKYKAVGEAESFQEMLARVDEMLGHLREKYQNKPEANVLLVSHGAYIHGIIMRIKNIGLCDFWKANVPNCAITIAELTDEGFIITRESDVADRCYVVK